MEHDIIGTPDRFRGTLYECFEFRGGLGMHHRIERVREAFEGGTLVAVRDVGLLREDIAGRARGIKAHHRIERETRILVPKDCPKAAHSLLRKVVAEGLDRNTPVRKRRERVRNIATGYADAGLVGRRQRSNEMPTSIVIPAVILEGQSPDRITGIFISFVCALPHHHIDFKLFRCGKDMHVVQIRSGAKPLDNRTNFTFGLRDDGKPDVVFVTAYVIVRNRRNPVDYSCEFIHIGNLARTEPRNKPEPTRIVDATDSADNARTTHVFDRFEDSLFGDGFTLTSPIQDIRKRPVRPLFQREGVLDSVKKRLFERGQDISSSVR